VDDTLTNGIKRAHGYPMAVPVNGPEGAPVPVADMGLDRGCPHVGGGTRSRLEGAQDMDTRWYCWTCGQDVGDQDRTQCADCEGRLRERFLVAVADHTKKQAGTKAHREEQAIAKGHDPLTF
jgi:hypothetical protein